MAIEVGNKISEKLSEDIKGSLIKGQITKIALECGMSFETAYNIIRRDTKITETNIHLVKALVKESYKVNNLHIRQLSNINISLAEICPEEVAA